jgi:hypothetical protein
MIERLCAETVIFVLWGFAGVFMWAMFGMEFLGPVRLVFFVPSLALFVAGFKILRKELRR